MTDAASPAHSDQEVSLLPSGCVSLVPLVLGCLISGPGHPMTFEAWLANTAIILRVQDPKQKRCRSCLINRCCVLDDLVEITDVGCVGESL